MDDMGRFERDLGIGLEQLAGPSLPVDASAVAHGVTAPTSRWRLGSPLRTLGLVTAAIVIVLLVGLAGVRLLSAPDAVDIEPATPTVTTDELLASMTTADVGAGVLEVIDDGAGHRLDSDESRAAGIETVHIGPGGDIWVRTRRAPDDFKNSVWQVGRPSTHIAGKEHNGAQHLQVGRDGTLWVWSWYSLHSFDGDTWTDHSAGRWDDKSRSEWGDTFGPVSGRFEGLAVQPDGAAWVAQPYLVRPLARLDDAGWSEFGAGAGIDTGVWQLLATPNGDLWVTLHTGVLRYVDGSWEHHIPLDGDQTQVELRLGGDGKPWARYPDHGFARFDGDSWHVVVETPPRSNEDEDQPWAIGTDGVVWLADLERGVGSFDGSTWVSHLDDIAVEAIDVSPGGTIWVASGNELAAFDGSEWARYALPVAVESFDVAADGGVWATSAYRLFVIHGGHR